MENYKYLNLPANPLKDKEGFIKHLAANPVVGGYNIYDDRVLSEEVIDAFSQIGLKVKFVAVFSRNDSQSKIPDRLIHADCTLAEDGKTWKKVYAGVNWELHENENEFSWWDMSAIKECWPAEILPKKYDSLNGIHYGKRGQLGLDPKAVCLEKAIVSGPTLVRTDIPHMVLYQSGPAKRASISVRFDPDFNSWEEAVEAFKPVTK
jgi:hypothetical protein